MILCDFKMNILFSYVGFEGSAHDAFVYERSGLINVFNRLPEHYYILADAVYGIKSKILTPFRGTRYHLQEYSSINSPNNAKELFNLRHSVKRNVIERVIGILKRRWKILKDGNESLDKEFINASITACMFLHNFLLIVNDLDCNDSLLDEEENDEQLNFTNSEDSRNNEAAKIWRNNLAKTMWERYSRNN